MSIHRLDLTPSRRGFVGLLGAAGSALALSACGGPTVSDGASGGASASADADFSGVTAAKEIDFWSVHPGKSQQVEQQLIAKFKEKTGITVNLVTAGSDYEELAQKFQSTLADPSGLPSCVVLSDVWWFRYFANKTIIALDPLIKQLQWDLSDYHESLVNDYQYAGKQWAMPYGRSTPLFYWNKDHWKAAGLPDRAPKTWDEFEQWAPKLMEANKSASGYASAYQYPDLAGYAGWTVQNLLWGRGAAWSKEWEITCADDPAVATLQWMQDSVHKAKWAGVSSKSATDDLTSGAVSATIASTGSLVGVLENAQFPVGVGFLPGGEASQSPVCPTGGAGLAIPAGVSKEQQLAAAEFIKFIGEPESTAAFSEATGYMPNRKSADMTKALAANPLLQVAMDQLKVTRPQDFARVFLPGADQEMAKMVQAVVVEQKDAKTELTQLKDKLDNIYTTQVKPKI